MDTHPRGSPLVQGGLEIPVEVTVSMPYSDKNRAALDKHEELVKKHYPELRSGRGRRNLILAGTKISKFTKIH